MTSSETTFNDEELIARLRVAWWAILAGSAADRIEELVATNEALQKALKDQFSVSDRLAEKLDKAEGNLALMIFERDEARLRKAVEALERAKASIENGGGGGVVDVVWLDDPCPETLCDFIDATLAEIKGENHDPL